MSASTLTAYERGVNELLWSIAPPSEATRGGQDEGPQFDPINDDDDLDRFLRDKFAMVLPHRKCCAQHSTPWDAFHDAYFAKHPISIWKASRGMGGKSHTLAALGITEAVTLRADVNVLGGSGEQSKRVLESMVKFWEVPTAPRDALTSEPGGQKQRLVWGNRIVALMASQASVRGPHPQRLRLDEIDEMKLDILNAALGQPMGKGWIQSQVVMSSTHQYANGTMTAMLKRAASEGFPVFEWCYRENLEPHGWLSLAEVERKRAILTAAMWDTEIELQEPSSEGRAMDSDKVKAAFRTDVKVEPPVAGGVYGSGADWAKKVNHTVIVTIRKDVRPRRVVAVKRTQREPWPSMAGYLDERVAAYGGTSTHDNTGLGQVVHDLLHHASEPFDMVGRNRADLLSEYIAAIEKGELLWPADDSDPALAAARSEHIYATREDVYKGSKDGSSRAHLPDTISAGALAWRAANQADGASATTPPDPAQTGRLERLHETIQRRRGIAPPAPPPEPEPEPPQDPVSPRDRWRRNSGE